jgi:hypothetical protein
VAVEGLCIDLLRGWALARLRGPRVTEDFELLFEREFEDGRAREALSVSNRRQPGHGPEQIEAVKSPIWEDRVRWAHLRREAEELLKAPAVPLK